jgi:hypothetical protein
MQSSLTTADHPRRHISQQSELSTAMVVPDFIFHPKIDSSGSTLPYLSRFSVKFSKNETSSTGLTWIKHSQGDQIRTRLPNYYLSFAVVPHVTFHCIYAKL